MTATVYKVTASNAQEGSLLSWALDEVAAKRILEDWARLYGELSATSIQSRQVTLTRKGVLAFLRIHCPERDNG